MKAELEIITGDMTGKRRVVDGLGSFSVGRSANNDLRIPDRGVSRQHCRIDHDGEHFWLVDCGSHNGTRLNGVAANNAMLYDGDTIKIGHTEMVFRQPAEDAQA